MSDLAWWTTRGRPVLEAVVLLATQHETPDDERLLHPSRALTPTDGRRSLVRLIGRGSLTGHPISLAEQVDPIRVVERSPTSLGLEDLSR